MSSQTFILAVVLTLASGQVPASDVDTPLRRLETFKPGDGTPSLNESIAAIRTNTAVGDAVIWKRLRAIIENPQIPLRVRTEVLRVAIEKADAGIAKDMLSLFDGWSVQLPVRSSAPHAASAEIEAGARVTLLGQFVGTLRNASWSRWIGSDPKTLPLLERVIIRTGPAMDINHDALESLVVSNAAPEARRAVAERILAARPGDTEPEPQLLQLLDPSSDAKLRTLVRQSNDPDKFHFAAAAALGHMGDLGIRADLESLLPSFQQKQPNAEGMLRYYLWQIDTQNPPTKLLDYIAAPPQHDPQRRMWAVRRAVQLGLGRPMIRKAVLKHASLVQPNGKTGVRPGLSSLKALCIELKVLDPTDLPDVVVPQWVPTE